MLGEIKKTPSFHFFERRKRMEKVEEENYSSIYSSINSKTKQRPYCLAVRSHFLCVKQFNYDTEIGSG